MAITTLRILGGLLLCGSLSLVLQACDNPGGPGRVPAELRLSATTLSIDDADSARVSVSVLDAEGKEISGSAAEGVAWSSTDTAIATVRDGIVTAIRPGQAEVGAALGSLTATAQVTVRPVATALIGVKGDAQNGIAGRPLRDSVVVRVVDRHQQPVAGVDVRFVVTAGGGSVSPASGTTDGEGYARSAWTLAMAPGPQGVEARAEGRSFPAVSFAAQSSGTFVTAGPHRYWLAYLGVAGTDSRALDLSESGQVVGYYTDGSGVETAFHWRDGRVTEVATGLAGSSRAVAVSAGGEVVGNVYGECTRAFLWKDTRRSVFPYCDRAATDVNDSGWILFHDGTVWRDDVLLPSPASTPTGFYAPRITRSRVPAHMFARITREGVRMYNAGIDSFQLYDLRGDRLSVPYSSAGPAMDLNDRLDVVGICARMACRLSGWLRLGGSESVSIKVDNTLSSGPVSINSQRQLVGEYSTSSGTGVYLWETGSAYRLRTEDPDWVIDEVSRINDRGQIAAHAVNTASGEKGAVLLTPLS